MQNLIFPLYDSRLVRLVVSLLKFPTMLNEEKNVRNFVLYNCPSSPREIY
jgi:hypothetical protein